MLLDIISAISLTVSAAIVTAALTFSLAGSPRARLRTVAALGAWFVVVVTLGASAALTPAHAGVPGLGLAIAIPVAILSWALLARAPLREAVASVPTQTLIAINALRVLGVSFLLLYAAQRLPAPFAQSAGWGDIFVGLTALPVAWLLGRYGSPARPVALAWNAVGLLDLVVAIALGATSSPGPARLFTAPPGTGVMTTLPWILIPCFVVPALMAVHVAIFARLSRERLANSTDVHAVLPAGPNPTP
jgi:hypothetical protein